MTVNPIATDYLLLIMRQTKLQKKIDKLNIEIQDLESHGYKKWWNPEMCHNIDECGDECFNGCDMPEELWCDKMNELKKKLEAN